MPRPDRNRRLIDKMMARIATLPKTPENEVIFQRMKSKIAKYAKRLKTK